MNFIGEIEGETMQVELKYCERCGGISLRLQGADVVYCAGCRVRLEVKPKPRTPPPKHTKLVRRPPSNLVS